MAYEYLFSALPVLPEALGEKPSMAPSELYALTSKDSDCVREISEAILLFFDVRALERLSLGAPAGPCAVFSESELRDMASLPVWLKGALNDSAHDAGAYGFGKVWKSYYKNLFEVAEKHSSAFFAGWLPWDLGFRSALADKRAHDAPVDGSSTEMGVGTILLKSEFKSQVEAIVSHKEKGHDSWRAIDIDVAKARIARAKELAPFYSFDQSELTSYIVQYVIYKEFEYV